MIRYKGLLIAALIPLAGAVASQSVKPAVTLDQAVVKVQRDTGGKVLSAESRGIGRRVEYRIKVLTSNGHVKVMVISSEASKNPPSTQSIKNQSTKNPPGRNAGSKERH